MLSRMDNRHLAFKIGFLPIGNGAQINQFKMTVDPVKGCKPHPSIFVYIKPPLTFECMYVLHWYMSKNGMRINTSSKWHATLSSQYLQNHVSPNPTQSTFDLMIVLFCSQTVGYYNSLFAKTRRSLQLMTLQKLLVTVWIEDTMMHNLIITCHKSHRTTYVSCGVMCFSVSYLYS